MNIIAELEKWISQCETERKTININNTFISFSFCQEKIRIEIEVKSEDVDIFEMDWVKCGNDECSGFCGASASDIFEEAARSIKDKGEEHEKAYSDILNHIDSCLQSYVM